VALCGAEPERVESATDAAFEGTIAHEVAAECLNLGVPANTFVGTLFTAGDGTQLEFTDDLAIDVQSYVGYVEHRLQMLRDEFAATGVLPQPELLVEHEIDISELTGEAGAHGTADAVLLGCGRMEVIDLKFGKGVQIEAEGNWQLRMYALGMLTDYERTIAVDDVATIIHQPRRKWIDESRYAVSELEEMKADILSSAAAVNSPNAMRVPGPAQCKFCRGKHRCPEYREFVLTTVTGEDPSAVATPEDFENVALVMPQPSTTVAAASEDWLGVLMNSVDMIESWCRAVRAETEARLLAGAQVPGWKIVEGKRGNRQWGSVEEAKAALEGFRLKVEEMYDLKLISPTTAEKLAKAGTIGPRQWKKLQALITQNEGKPSVAPASDPRPALSMQANAADFDDTSST
jgi:hypothetical protein